MTRNLLFIGGNSDGKKLPVNDDVSFVSHIVYRPSEVIQMSTLSETVEGKKEFYTRRVIHLPGDVSLDMFVLVDLNDYIALEMLIEGYRRG